MPTPSRLASVRWEGLLLGTGRGCSLTPDASNVATSGLPVDLCVNRPRRDPRAGGGAAGGESGLLREDEAGRAGRRLRPSCAEVGSGEGVLRGLRLWPRSFPHPGDSVRVSAHRRGIFCHPFDSRARPLAPSASSSAASLALLSGVGSSATADEEKETQQEDSMKYLLMIVAAIALVGTASATSRSADCCGGAACCLVNLSCCAK
ncbi:MAG: hypothetical protein QOC70_1776 [Verrucomicrobiota bacterium]